MSELALVHNDQARLAAKKSQSHNYLPFFPRFSSIQNVPTNPDAMPTTTPEHDARIAALTFAGVYPHYVAKIEKKGRTIEELHRVIEWLTGFDETKLQELIEQKVTFKEFFDQAKMNPNAELIKGVICGYSIEDITTKLTREVRYLDKVVEELAKGKNIEKIMRGS